MRRPACGLVVAALALVATAAPARAGEEEKIASYAVQNRKFGLGNELHLGVGTLPLNAFTKGLTLGAGYTYHFSDVWAWEAVQGFYSLGFDTGLKKQLLENFEVEPTSFPEVEAVVTSSMVLKPLYGKFAWFNRKVVHGELFFAGGLGLARYRHPIEMKGAVDLGFGLRVYLSQHVSVRFDARWMSFVPQDLRPIKNDIYLALSLSFSGGRH